MKCAPNGRIKLLVTDILIDTPAARDSDKTLILAVYKRMGFNTAAPFETLLFNDALPSFETIRRTRQKVQECYPNLRSSASVQAERENNRAMWREWATGGEI